MNLVGHENDFERDLEKMVIPPPIIETLSAMDDDTLIPGEFKVDEGGLLLKKYFKFSGFSADLIEAYDSWIYNKLLLQIQARPIVFPDGSYALAQEVKFQPPDITIDGKIKKITPQMAREGKLSYLATIYVLFHRVKDIIITDKDGTQRKCRETIEKGKDYINIGQIPVMLGSILCNLRGMTRHQKLAVGECPEDPLGYFIVKGAEKIVLLMEKLRPRKILIFNETAKGNPVCKLIVRNLRVSTVIKLYRISKTGVIHVDLTDFPSREKNKDTFKNFEEKTLCCLQVFRLLGVVERNEIENYIMLFVNPKWVKKVKSVLSTSFRYIEAIGDDVEYLISEKRFKSIIDGKNYAEKKNTILTVLLKDFFPHMQEDSYRKRLFLYSMMIARYAENLAGVRSLDDRDSWSNKRVETAAVAMEKLFAMSINISHKEIEEELAKSFKKSPSDLSTMKKKIKPAKITLDFVNSFVSNNWGPKNSNYKANITDILKRENLIATLAHLTRISIRTAVQGKQAETRFVDMRQYGYIGPFDTPEGEQCGLTKYKAITCFITVDRADDIIMLKIREHIVDLKTADYETSVLVNAKFVGWCQGKFLRDKLVSLRRNLTLHRDTMILLDDEDSVLFIHTDEGRLVRPLLTVEDNNLVLDEKDLWKKPFETLLRNGAAEYLDAWEQEYILLSVSVKNLETKKAALQQLIQRKDELISIISRMDNGEMVLPIEGMARSDIIKSQESLNEEFQEKDERLRKILTEKTDLQGKELQTILERKNRVILLDSLVKEEKELKDKLEELKAEIEKINAKRFQEEISEEDKFSTYQKTIRQELSQTTDEISSLKNRRSYSHCELSPDSMFSFSGSIIPLPETTQGPRNSLRVANNRRLWTRKSPGARLN